MTCGKNLDGNQTGDSEIINHYSSSAVCYKVKDCSVDKMIGEFIFQLFSILGINASHYDEIYTLIVYSGPSNYY